MKNRIHDAFDEIRADDALKEKTVAYLRQERTRREKHNRILRPGRLVLSFTTMLVLCIGIFTYYVNFAAAAYVNIDINPSVELTLNRRDRVIATYAFDEDGDQILQEMDLDGKMYSEAAALLVAAISAEGYLGANPLVSMTVQTSSSDKELDLCSTLRACVNEQIDALQAAAEVEVFPVSLEEHSDAHKRNMSPAKHIAITELMEVDEDATLEEYSQSSISQIRQRTQQCKNEHSSSHENRQENNQGSGQGHGQGNGSSNGHRNSN